MKYTIDAENRTLGRVAAEAARALLGKLMTSFKKNEVAEVSVEVINVSKMKLSEKKLKEKEYSSYSGYPGGLSFLSMEVLIQKKGVSEVVRRAVYKMLPKNKLQAKRIKLLKIKE
ncbi:MAG TPA: uL13 family ribosomal protein [Candidatus Paceibacterota bacterium]